MSRKPKAGGASQAPSSATVNKETAAQAAASSLADEAAPVTDTAGAPIIDGEAKTDSEAVSPEALAEAARLEAQAAEKAERDRLEAERLAAEQAESERVAAEQAEAARLAAEQEEADRIAAESAAQHREFSSDPLDSFEYPLVMRVSNKTHMPVQVPSAKLTLGPFPDSQDVNVESADAARNLFRELDTIRTINGFSHEAFAIDLVTEDEE